MPVSLGRERVQELLRQGAQLVEALPAEDYAKEHIAGAINIPIKQLNPAGVAELDRSRPVITYCHDGQCDVGPRAARRLETLGFHPVFDYPGGKMDWFAFGLPRRGREPVLQDIMRRDVPTCDLAQTAGQAQAAMAAGDWSLAVVVDERGIVLGRLRRSRLGPDPDAPVDKVMEEGPSTYRPNVPLAQMIERMKAGGFERALITDPDGRLLGLVTRLDAEAEIP